MKNRMGVGRCCCAGKDGDGGDGGDCAFETCSPDCPSSWSDIDGGVIGVIPPGTYCGFADGPAPRFEADGEVYLNTGVCFMIAPGMSRPYPSVWGTHTIFDVEFDSTMNDYAATAGCRATGGGSAPAAAHTLSFEPFDGIDVSFSHLRFETSSSTHTSFSFSGYENIGTYSQTDLADSIKLGVRVTYVNMIERTSISPYGCAEIWRVLCEAFIDDVLVYDIWLTAAIWQAKVTAGCSGTLGVAMSNGADVSNSPTNLKITAISVSAS